MLPHATARPLEKLDTAVGVSFSRLNVPSPPSQLSSSPQQSAVPSVRTAHVWNSPAAIESALMPIDTGLSCSVPEPSPTSPSKFAPQQYTDVSERIAHEWYAPPSIFATLVM